MRIQILFILLFTSIRISAQQKGFSLEPLAGLGSSKAVQSGTNNLGLKAGCGLVYMFNRHWGISSGLQVQQYSTKITSGTDSEYFGYVFGGGFWQYNSVQANYNFTYWELPISVRYLSGQDGKFGVFGEGGFIVSNLISTIESGYIHGFAIYTSGLMPSAGPYSNSFKSNVSNANTFNFQWHLALGVFIPVNNTCSILVDFSINQGFENIGNSSKDYIDTPPGGAFYFYNKNNYYTSESLKYGTNFSELIDIRLNIKLGNKPVPSISK